MGAVEIDHLKSQTPAAAGLPRCLTTEDGHPGISRLKEGVAIVDHPHQHPQPQHIAVPGDHFVPLGSADFNTEKRRSMMDREAHAVTVSGALAGPGPGMVQAESVFIVVVPGRPLARPEASFGFAGRWLPFRKLAEKPTI